MVCLVSSIVTKVEILRAICSLRCAGSLILRKLEPAPTGPQSDGMIERFNHTVAQMLATFVQGKKRSWDEHLPFVMLAYGSTIHETGMRTDFEKKPENSQGYGAALGPQRGTGAGPLWGAQGAQPRKLLGFQHFADQKSIFLQGNYVNYH